MNYKRVIIDPKHGGIDFGYRLNDSYEKDFNLLVARGIYNRLKDYGYPVYLVRDSDITMSNYDRYHYINNLVRDDSNLIILFQLDSENKNDISIIRSLNGGNNTNNMIYDEFSRLGIVKEKSLVNDKSKDYYALQRLITSNNDVIVMEIGENYLRENKGDELVNSISDTIINYFSKLGIKNEIYDSYIVEKGDYLYKIANRFNTSVENLKRVNNLGTNFLNVGEVLKVPRIFDNIYVVKSGDSLYSIAKKYNTTVDKIKDINKLISNKLMINQKLIIPS